MIGSIVQYVTDRDSQNEDKDVPKTPQRAKWLSEMAKATYPSRGPGRTEWIRARRPGTSLQRARDLQRPWWRHWRIQTPRRDPTERHRRRWGTLAS